MKSAKFASDDPKKASEWVLAGKVLAYPSESVWGLGCDAFNKQAVRQLLTLKERPIDKGLIVLCASIEQVQVFLQPLPCHRKNDIVASWQTTTKQASTWLFEIPSHLSIPDWLTGKHDSLAIRVIAHPSIQTICQSLISTKNPYGFLVSTSCNINNQPPAQDFDGAFDYFQDKVGYFCDDTLGYNQPSQIKHAHTGQMVRA